MSQIMSGTGTSRLPCGPVTCIDIYYSGKTTLAVDRAASDAANAMVSGLGVPAGTDTAVESRHLLQRMGDYMVGQGCPPVP
jgi:hypothetical protein